MKILYVITSTDLGGAEKALLELVRSVSKEHTVNVISLKPFGVLAKQIEEAGANEVISLNMKGLGWNSLSSLQNEIESFQPDIIHAMLFRAIEFTRWVCRKNGYPLITTPHFDMSKRNRFLQMLDRFLAVRDTYTLGESKTTVNYLINKQKYRKNKVIYIGNSPVQGAFFPNDSARLRMRKEYHYEKDNIIFLSVARLEKIKNPILLLKAFYELWRHDSTVRLVYVGDGTERPEMEDFIRKHKMKKGVFLAGIQENINDWLNMADIFVLPSTEESLPIALLEAIQTGKPCIVTRAGDMALWVKNKENGLIIPPTIDGLIEALSLMTKNPLNIKKMELLSLERASHIKNSIQLQKNIYHKIMEKSFHVKTV